jgi:hypothetical protein
MKLICHRRWRVVHDDSWIHLRVHHFNGRHGLIQTKSRPVNHLTHLQLICGLVKKLPRRQDKTRRHKNANEVVTNEALLKAGTTDYMQARRSPL